MSTGPSVHTGRRIVERFAERIVVVVGDVKGGSLTVVSGARMRGRAEFGWGDDKASKSVKGSVAERSIGS